MKHSWMTIARDGEGAGGGAEGGANGGQQSALPDFIPQGLDLPSDVIGPDAATTIGNLYTRLQDAGKPPYDPDKLADEYKGKTPAEVFTMMNTRIEGLRGELGKRGEVPKDAAGYQFTPTETAAKYMVARPEGEADPVLEIAKQVAHSNGLPVTAFNGFVNGMYEKMAEAGLVAEPINPKAEIAAFAKAENLPDETAAARRVDELANWGKAFAQQMKLGEAEATELDVLTDTAAGLRVLSTLQKAFMERGLDIGGAPAGAKTMTDAEFAKLSASDEINPSSKEFNADVRARWEAESNRRADLKARKAG